MTATLVFVAGCTSVEKDPSSTGPILVWPPGEGRVQFEGEIRLRSDLEVARSTLRNVFKGKDDSPLFTRPYGLAWDGDALVVADPGAQQVIRIDLNGKIWVSTGSHFEFPTAVAACEQGIVVSDARAGRVVLLDRQLRPKAKLAESLHRPTGVACTRGRIFVVETGNHRVLMLDDDGATRSIGSHGIAVGNFNYPTSIVLDGSTLWIGDALNFRVHRYDLTKMEFVSTFGRLGDSEGEMPRPKGIAVDRFGNLWVSDAHLDSVSLFSPTGDYLMSIGGTGAAPGRFAFPNGIAAHPDGRVAVSDSFNRRIQIFRTLATEGMPDGSQ
jgi:sugar lactone lactonase YvrE